MCSFPPVALTRGCEASPSVLFNSIVAFRHPYRMCLRRLQVIPIILVWNAAIASEVWPWDCYLPSVDGPGPRLSGSGYCCSPGSREFAKIFLSPTFPVRSLEPPETYKRRAFLEPKSPIQLYRPRWTRPPNKPPYHPNTIFTAHPNIVHHGCRQVTPRLHRHRPR